MAPSNDLESAIITTLTPGNYTAVVRGDQNTTGIGVVEVYDLDQTVDSLLANISSRGLVKTGNNVMIGGFIVGGGTGSSKVALRAIGPSLGQQGVPNPLADPTLELRDGNGALLIANNDWKDDPAQAAELVTIGIAAAKRFRIRAHRDSAAGPEHGNRRRQGRRDRGRARRSLSPSVTAMFSHRKEEAST